MAEVELPQLGESVTEGVITQWLVEVGDEVSEDQPIVEISTDKVDTEIPSPVAGVVQELRAEVDDTVEVGDVIAVIGDEPAESGEDGGGQEDAAAEEGGADDEAEEAAEAEEATEAAADAGAPEETEEASEEAMASSDADSEPEPEKRKAPATPTGPGAQADGDGGVSGEAALTSPLVRKMLREAGLEASDVRGTGKGGRITREDAERAIEAGGEGEPGEAAEAEAAPARAAEAPAGRAASAPPPPPTPAGPQERERPEASPLQVDFGGEREVQQDLSRVRKAIAKAMHRSLQETAQLTAAVEVDVTSVMNLRTHKKDAFKRRHGVSLSPLPFFARAVCMTVPRHPAINASIDVEGGTATFHSYVNLGMAVDTPNGLIVPNIKNAEDLNIPGLAKRISDLASRTRDRKLGPDDIRGGTITITNTGSRGTLFDTPILNPPEVAILATCAIEKRAVVVSDNFGDSIAIRWMTYLCLTYDHRMVDGADAARFLQDLKWVVETHDFSGELGV